MAKDDLELVDLSSASRVAPSSVYAALGIKPKGFSHASKYSANQDTASAPNQLFTKPSIPLTHTHPTPKHPYSSRHPRALTWTKNLSHQHRPMNMGQAFEFPCLLPTGPML